MEHVLARVIHCYKNSPCSGEGKCSAALTEFREEFLSTTVMPDVRTLPGGFEDARAP